MEVKTAFTEGRTNKKVKQLKDELVYHMIKKQSSFEI